MRLNTVERIRIKLGLTRPQMRRVMGLPPSTTNTLFTISDQRASPADKMRAKDLEMAYDYWRDNLLAEVDRDEADKGTHLLSGMEVSHLIHISEFHISQLRARGEVGATMVTPQRYVYGYDDVRKLIRSNSTVIEHQTRKQRGPLANAFLSSLHLAVT